MSPGRWSRSLCSLSFVALAFAACTKANPDACCENDAQCAALGVDGRRACENGQTCSPVTLACVAPECAANTDCDPSTPVCSNRVCIAACHTNDDCTADAATPLCQTETGTCVGCLDASSCSADAPYCDASAHACRGCALDAECPSGVCIEADAVCAKPEQLLYVSSIGADTGDCVAAPCATISYALQKVTETRTVIRAVGEQSTLLEVVFQAAVVIDGDGATSFRAGPNHPVFSYPQLRSGVVTLEGIVLSSDGPLRDAILVDGGNSLRLFNVSLASSRIRATGSLDVRAVRATNSSVACTNGTLTVRESAFDTSGIETSNCALTVTRSRFAPAFTAVVSMGGLLKIENNVFVSPSEFADIIHIVSNAPGSLFAFNTIVNTSTVVQSPVAIFCDPLVQVTSNIIAYNSTRPIGGDGCTVRSSLFDLPTGTAMPGNDVAAVSTIFRNFAVGDYHLAPNSPALGKGEANLVDVDFDGKSRPSPSGSPPDVGAFEAR